eukprot:3936860-Amphidinium_carterae.1
MELHTVSNWLKRNIATQIWGSGTLASRTSKGEGSPTALNELHPSWHFTSRYHPQLLEKRVVAD